MNVNTFQQVIGIKLTFSNDYRTSDYSGLYSGASRMGCPVIVKNYLFHTFMEMGFETRHILPQIINRHTRKTLAYSILEPKWTTTTFSSYDQRHLHRNKTKQNGNK